MLKTARCIDFFVILYVLTGKENAKPQTVGKIKVLIFSERDEKFYILHALISSPKSL